MSVSTIVYSRSALRSLGTERISADLSKALDLVTSRVLSAARENIHTVTVTLTLFDPTTVVNLVEQLTNRFPDVNIVHGSVPNIIQAPTRVPAYVPYNACIVLTWE